MTASPEARSGKRRWKVIAFVTLIGVALAALGAFVNMVGPVDARSRLQAIDRMYEEYRRDFPGVPSVTPGEVRFMLGQDGAVLVDARDDYERAVSRIPDSITLEEFEASREDYRGMQVVVYCTIGSRSGRCAFGLREQGYDAYNLKGGVLAWAHAGYEFEDDAGPTVRVHTFGRKWALLPEGYEAVY